MPLIITRTEPRPNGTSIPKSLDWLMGIANQALEYLKGLVTLNADLRETRSLEAERAVLFTSAVVINTAVTVMQALEPRTAAETFTTMLVAFDAGSGAGRYRIDGSAPTPNSAIAGSGMPIPAGGYTLTIVGALNIRSFQVTAETATALDMSITLFK